MASSLRPLFVVAGVGGGTGTGATTARLFSKSGFSVALIARNKQSLEKLSNEINEGGGNAKPFAVTSYTQKDFTNVFNDIKSVFPSSQYVLRAALFNAGSAVWKPFLSITEQEFLDTINGNVVAAWGFSQEVIKLLKESSNDEETGRGTLIFTGATASIRGNVVTSAFSAGKHGVRALSQSLAKEFGPDGIHVSHAIIDGGIVTGNVTARGAGATKGLSPESIAKSYLHLVQQEKTAWTWELDLRPSFEKW